MMPRYNRFSKMHPVKSEKEELTWSNLAQDAGTAQINIEIAEAADNPTAPGKVEVGDTINAIYFEFHFAAETITNPKVIHWTISKVPAGATSMVNSPNTYDSNIKRFVLKRGMEMLPKNVSTVFKRVFVVRLPPRIKRMASADQVMFSYQCSSTETINACGIAIFRHFS